MLKRILSLLIVCLVITGAPVMRDACADIPAGVKTEYQYNQKDSSIIVVKKRLQELGYFNEKAVFSDFVSKDLKTAVLRFQKQNGLAQNGNIDKKFLNALFSDDAITMDGKKLPKSSKPTKAPETKKNSSSKNSNSNSSKNSSKNSKNSNSSRKQSNTIEGIGEIKTPASGGGKSIFGGVGLYAAIGGALVLVLALLFLGKLRKAVRKQALTDIIHRYMEMKRDIRCKKAIKDSGLIIRLLAAGGEYLFLPLKKKGPRFEREIVQKTAVQCRTNIVLLLDGIAREGLENEAGRKLCAAWYRRKKGRIKEEAGAKEYQEAIRLFELLVGSGIIDDDDRRTRDAFFLLLWECALDENEKHKRKVEETIDHVNRKIQEAGEDDYCGINAYLRDSTSVVISGAYRKAVYIFYEIERYKESAVTILLTAKEYIDDGKTLWQELYLRNRKKVKAVVAGIPEPDEEEEEG